MPILKANILSSIFNSSDYFSSLSITERAQLKVMFNYGHAESTEDKIFMEAYNQWSAVKQCNFIKNGKLQVALIPLKSDLSLDINKKKYLHTSQIQFLDLDCETYGFHGNIKFAIPYNLSKETLWSDYLLKHNLLALQISYQEDKLNNGKYVVNKDTAWQLQAYIDASNSNNRKLVDKMSVFQYQNKTEHYLSCSFTFVDSFTFIAKQHFPIEVYVKQDYSSIFNDIFSSWNNLFNLEMGNNLAAFSSIRPWICLNCKYPNISFYDFFFRTLEHYQYQLQYDYTKLDPTYTIIDPNQAEKTSSSVTLEQGIIDDILWQKPNYHFANIQQDNHHWSNQTIADSENIKNALFAQAPVVRKSVSCCPTSQDFQNLTKSIKAKTTLDLNHQYKFSISFRYFSGVMSLLPTKQFKAPEGYQKLFASNSENFEINTTKIKFKHHSSQAIYAGETSVYTVTPTSDNISHIDYDLQHGISIQADVSLADQIQAIYPKYNDFEETLQVYGWVSDFNSSATDRTYFLTSGDNQDGQDIAASFVAQNTNYAPMHYTSESQLSYVIKLAKKALIPSGSDSETLNITLPYYVMHDHQVVPLRKNTAVMVSLNQEVGNIDYAIWHSLENKTFSKDSQINKMTFGVNDAAGIVHSAKLNSLDAATLEIFAQTGKNSNQIISDAEQISIIYSNATKGE